MDLLLFMSPLYLVLLNEISYTVVAFSYQQLKVAILLHIQ